MSKRQLNSSLRIKILRRDNFSCRKCHIKFVGGYGIEIHHINSFRESEDNSINNLISLCKVCHVMSPIDNKKFYEWLNSNKIKLEEPEDSQLNTFFIKLRHLYHNAVVKQYG